VLVVNETSLPRVYFLCWKQRRASPVARNSVKHLLWGVFELLPIFDFRLPIVSCGGDRQLEIANE
jgi:hypothetical protein